MGMPLMGLYFVSFLVVRMVAPGKAVPPAPEDGGKRV
jgi:hypothetical protein